MQYILCDVAEETWFGY